MSEHAFPPLPPGYIGGGSSNGGSLLEHISQANASAKADTNRRRSRSAKAAATDSGETDSSTEETRTQPAATSHRNKYLIGGVAGVAGIAGVSYLSEVVDVVKSFGPFWLLAFVALALTFNLGGQFLNYRREQSRENEVRQLLMVIQDLGTRYDMQSESTKEAINNNTEMMRDFREALTALVTRLDAQSQFLHTHNSGRKRDT